MPDKLYDLQCAIRDRLKLCQLMAGPPAIEVLAQDRGDLGERLSEHLAKAGVCVVVGEPGVEDAHGTPPGVVQAVVPIEIYETFVVNRAQSGARVSGRELSLAAIVTLVYADNERRAQWDPGSGFSPLMLRSCSPTAYAEQEQRLIRTLTMLSYFRI